MTRSRLLWVGTLALLIAGFAIDRHATRRRLEELGRKYDAEVSRAAHERNIVLEQPALLALASSAARGGPQVVAGPPETNPPTSAEAPKSAGDKPTTMSEHAAHIDMMFSAEPQGGTWSQAAESRLSSALAPFAVGGARIQQVACRNTLCKVRVEHTTDAGIRDVMDQVFSTDGFWTGSMVTMRDPSSPPGTFAHLVYLAKEGHGIPFLEN